MPQTHDAEAGAIALLGMGPVVEDGLVQRAGARRWRRRGRRRQAIETAFEDRLDVPIRAGARQEGACTQRLEDGTIECFEELAAALAVAAHDPRVELLDQLADAGIEFAERKELLVAQSGEDPPFHDLYSDLDFRLLQSQQMQRMPSIQSGFGSRTRFIHCVGSGFGSW